MNLSDDDDTEERPPDRPTTQPVGAMEWNRNWRAINYIIIIIVICEIISKSAFFNFNAIHPPITPTADDDDGDGDDDD